MKKTYVLSFLLASSIGIAHGQSWIKEMGVFLYCAMTNFQSVGAVAPFSKSTAQAMNKPLQEQLAHKQNVTPFRLIEVGAGTGALTQHFIQMLEDSGANYALELVELNPEFCKILQQKFQHNPRVSIHCADITKWQTEQEYDALISTLPFNCKDFSPDTISAILHKYESIVRHEGLMFSVEYIMVGNLSKLVWKKQHCKLYDEKHEIFDDFKKRHQAQREVVIANLPPTYVFTLKINKEHANVDL